MKVEKVDLERAFASIEEPWQPRIAAVANGTAVKLVKLDGEFVWHSHEVEDEIFLVRRGRLTMRFRDRDVVLEEGELLLVPHGVEHCPIGEPGTEVLLIEPAGTPNTGDAGGPRTVEARPL